MTVASVYRAAILALGLAFTGQAQGAASVEPAQAPLSIVVYEQPGLKGRAVTIDRAVPDLAALKFDDKVASLEIRGVGDWMLCEHRNYAGRCVRVSARADDLKLLQMGGRVSSLYPVPSTPAPAAAAP